MLCLLYEKLTHGKCDQQKMLLINILCLRDVGLPLERSHSSHHFAFFLNHANATSLRAAYSDSVVGVDARVRVEMVSAAERRGVQFITTREQSTRIDIHIVPREQVF